MASQTRLDRATWRPLHNRILLALGIGWAPAWRRNPHARRAGEGLLDPQK